MSVTMPTIGLYVGFAQTANTGAWTLGTSDLGTGTVLGDAFIWTYTDITADIREWRLQRGKARELDHYNPGTLTVRLDNRTRDYDPLNLAGSYVSSGVTDVRPGRPVYITATHPTTGTVHELFRGKIRRWDLDYTGKFDSTATIQATDQLTDLANVDVSLTTTAGDSGAAAGEVLVEAGVTQFTSPTGVSTLQQTVWATSALQALRTIEKAERGAVYAERDGDVVVAPRSALVSDARSRNSQATFGSGDLTFTDIDIAYEGDLIRNSVTLTRTGGVAQTATDQTSIDTYGKRSLSETGYPNSLDSEVASIAAHIVGRFGEPYVRIASIDLAPQKNEALMTQALSRRLRDRVTVTFSPVGGGDPISQEVFITGIRHEATARAGMKTVFSFEPTDWSYGWLLGTDSLGAAKLGF